jgi:hypothetical protein
VRLGGRAHDSPGDHREAERQQHLERPHRNALGDEAPGLALEPHQVDTAAGEHAGHSGADESGDGLGGDVQRACWQQRAGRQRQQPIVAGGERAAEQRHHQREVLDEGGAARDAGIEPPQHDLDDRQQGQGGQREYRQRVLEPLQRAVVIDAPRLGRRVGVDRHLPPRLLRNASRSRRPWS